MANPNMKGHEINLASGVMFSPQQEEARVLKEREALVRDLTIQHMADEYGYRVEYHKRPSHVHEFHFYDGDKMVARRSVNREMIMEGARSTAGRMMEDVVSQLGGSFSWDDLPEGADPEARPRVDNVGRPPETEYNERVAAGSPPEPDEEPEEDESPEEQPRAEETLPFSDDMTIRQLKDWASDNDMTVPSEITRKGDILEWMANEYSDRS